MEIMAGFIVGVAATTGSTWESMVGAMGTGTAATLDMEEFEDVSTFTDVDARLTPITWAKVATMIINDRILELRRS